MAAARKKTKAKAKSKARAKSKSKARPAAKKARKAAIKRPKRSNEPQAPLKQMDAAWQSLLETAIERHHSGSGAEGAASKTARKK